MLLWENEMKINQKRTYLKVFSVAVLNDLEQGLKITCMTSALVMLPVVSIGEDFLFPWRQLPLLFILNDGVLEDDEGVLFHPTVKNVSKKLINKAKGRGLTKQATRQFLCYRR